MNVNKKPIYLDYNATTPVDSSVFQAMKPYLEAEFGNPESVTHAYGWEAEAAVNLARKQVARLIGAKEKEIFWTSGATESNNMALLGYVRRHLRKLSPQLSPQGLDEAHEGRVKGGGRPHIITSQVEHKVVLKVCEWLVSEGVEVSFLNVNKYGQVRPEDISQVIRPNTILVSIMAANNEIGSLNSLKEIGHITRERGLIFHTDAAQAVGKSPIDVEAMNIDLLSLSSHKLYGPKGCGALYIRQNPRVELEPLMFGGRQEGGLRPGTLNVPGIVGLGKACELCHKQMEEESQKLTRFRDHLIQSVLDAVPSAVLNGHPTERLPNNVSFSFRGLSSDLFTLGLYGLACSSTSACSSGEPEASHVLKAIGHDNALARGTLRFGLGRWTTEGDIQTAIDRVIQMAKKNADLTIKTIEP